MNLNEEISYHKFFNRYNNNIIFSISLVYCLGIIGYCSYIESNILVTVSVLIFLGIETLKHCIYIFRKTHNIRSEIFYYYDKLYILHCFTNFMSFAMFIFTFYILIDHNFTLKQQIAILLVSIQSISQIFIIILIKIIACRISNTQMNIEELVIYQ